MATLVTDQRIGRFTVQNLIKENLYTETYRVQDEDNNPYFLKAFLVKKMPEKMLNPETGIVYEIERSKDIEHKNIISFIESGFLELEQGSLQYYVTNYLSGEVLADKIHREGKLDETTALAIFRSILEGLQYLHGKGLYHNDITPRNIMLSNNNAIEPQIVDLGHVSGACNGKAPFDVTDLEVYYTANESLIGIFDERSDAFSATAVLYAMLFGSAPWKTDLPENASLARKAMLMKDYRKNNPYDWNEFPFSAPLKAILTKGLATDYRSRASGVGFLLNAASCDVELDCDTNDDNSKVSDSEPIDVDNSSRRSSGRKEKDERDPNSVVFSIKRVGSGNGFKDIAGMGELKKYLTEKVIFILKDQEKAKRYKLTPPNAMLLYGPPGCGKTYVAEKFAEEIGCNYIFVKTSDLASTYIHGSQQMIARLFKQAEKNRPTVICFDEFDALVPDRSNFFTQNVASEVNEFLTQLNNCSKRGIFVVATTNRPDKIDSAVLRRGRVDKLVYVPLPDKEARTEMFRLHIDGRPYDNKNIDFDKLSALTEGYIASDIAHIVDDASMVAAYTGVDITQTHLEQSIKNTSPSFHKEVLDRYEAIREQMEGVERKELTRKPIGFNSK